MLQEEEEHHHYRQEQHQEHIADTMASTSTHDAPSHIAMASKVAAPLAVRPSPPRAVSNNLKKRVPAPRMTEDEAALEEEEAARSNTSASTTPLVNASPSMEKDRFAALLALGVAHQQQQQQLQLKQLATSNTPSTRPGAAGPSSTSSTIIPLHPAGTLFADEKAIAFNPSSSSPIVHHHHQSEDPLNGNTIPEHALGMSTTPLHISNPSTLVGNSKLEYIRPKRSNSTLSLVGNSTDNTNTILQQHRLNGISGQSHSTSRSISTTPSSSSGTALPSINFISSSTTPLGSSSTNSYTTSNKMAALAARWGNSASAKLQSMSSNHNNGTTSSSSKGSTSSSYTGNNGYHSILDQNSRNAAGAMSGPSDYSSHSSPSNTSDRLFQSDNALTPTSSSTDRNGNISSSSGASFTSSSTTTTNNNTQGTLGGHSKEAISKAVNIANRFKKAASNKMRGSGGNDHIRSLHGIEESSSSNTSNTINMNDSRDCLPQQLSHSQSQSQSTSSQMSKSSSLRSLSSFSNAIRTSSSNNLRKFSPSFSTSTTSNDNNHNLSSNNSSSITMASNSNTLGNGTQDGQVESITERSTGRRLGLHKSTTSSISNSLGLTHRQSPLSNNSISSSSSSSNSRHAPTSQNISKDSFINRSNHSSNGKYKTILGVNVPLGRAGEVFGAPLNVAADRTRLLTNVNDHVPPLPGHAEMQEEEIARRKEACFFLPAIAIRCLDYLNEYGKTEEGLYRIPGSTLEILNLKIIFDSGKDLNLLLSFNTRILEPSAVASCFKLWLRELPESLLHNMEREIDILLLEHTGNAASSKVTMAQAQSPSPPNTSNLNNTSNNTTGVFANQQKMPHAIGLSGQQSNTTTTTSASPLVVKRIKDLFANNLPKENVILLREISYHLAHLASFSNVTKMTFSNLRLILSPTLRLSPVMLSLLVNEREHIFPKPGTFLAAHQSGNKFEGIQFNESKLDLSLPSSNTSTTSRVATAQPKLTLSLPGENGLPPIPPSKSPIARYGQGGVSSSSPPTIDLRTPFSSSDSDWTSFSSPGQSSSSEQTSSSRKLNGSAMPGYRASWHVVDLPTPAANSTGNRKDSSESTDSDGGTAATPIAKKFLNQRLSLSNLLDNKERGTSPSSPAASEAGSRRSISSNGSNMLTRIPTLTGRSPSPFFSSGAPPAALGFMATHSRKRSSASSFSSVVSNSVGPGGTTGPAGGSIWRSRKVSPQHDQSPKILQQSPKINDKEDDKNAQYEEEELSNSDTNTSICSSTSSAKTPSDQHDLPSDSASRDETVHIAGTSVEDEEESGDLLSNITVDSRRATITAESFGQESFARTGKGKNANNEEMRSKRGSVMITNMPHFSYSSS